MSELELDQYGRVKECINCGNTDHPDEPNAIYCKKCGFALVNECTNIEIKDMGPLGKTNLCKRKLPPDANYCPYCGHESIFNRMRKAKELEDLPF